MGPFSLIAAGYFLAQSDQCSLNFIDNKMFNTCVHLEPECRLAVATPPPSEFAAQRGLSLVNQQPIVFSETGRQAILNVFLSETDIEYWVYFFDTQEVCLMMSGYEVT